MSTIKIIIRKNITNKEGKHPLKLRLYKDNKSKEISIPNSWVYEKQFNKEKQRVTNDKTLNLRIQGALSKYLNAITKLSSFENDFTLEDVHNYANEIELKKPATKVDLHTIAYIESFIVDDKDNYAYGTRRHYRSFTNLLTRVGYNPLLSEVDSSNIKKFEQRLIRTTNLKQSTIWSHCKKLKATVNHAYNSGHIKSPNWKYSKQLRIDKGTVMKGDYLTDVQLKKLDEYKLESETDKQIRSAYLFTFYSCGARFGDLCVLNYSNINLEKIGDQKRYTLRYTQRKTGTTVFVPLSESSLAYIDTSLAGTDSLIFSFLTKYDMKQERDHIAKKIEGASIYANRRLKLIMKSSGIEGKYTFHSSRRGFISRCIKLGIHNSVIMDISGLRTSKILDDHYAKIAGGQLLNAVNKL